MARSAIGYALTKVLGEGGLAESISPTDLAMDTSSAMANFQAFLEEWENSPDESYRRAARKLLTPVRQIVELTADKYRFARED